MWITNQIIESEGVSEAPDAKVVNGSFAAFGEAMKRRSLNFRVEMAFARN